MKNYPNLFIVFSLLFPLLLNAQVLEKIDRGVVTNRQQLFLFILFMNMFTATGVPNRAINRGAEIIQEQAIKGRQVKRLQ
jgi:hypothetical protein